MLNIRRLIGGEFFLIFLRNQEPTTFLISVWYCFVVIYFPRYILRYFFEHLSNFIIVHGISIIIVGVEALNPLLNKVQCASKECKGFCWWSSWKRNVITTDCIARSSCRMLLVVCYLSYFSIVHLGSYVYFIWIKSNFRMNIHASASILLDYNIDNHPSKKYTVIEHKSWR